MSIVKLFRKQKGRFCTKATFQRNCKVFSLGMIEYEEAWEFQKKLMKMHWHGIGDDAIILLQHPSVYTLGRRASLDNIRFKPEDNRFKLVRVDRGGEVTYHGPGQLVVYPIINLDHYKKDLHWYLRQVEQVVIDILKDFDVSAERVNGLTGVWANNKKIAAVGTHASKWITMHGFGLNVTTDLEAFKHIVPCGINDRSVGKLQEYVPNVSIEKVEQVAIRCFGDIFGCKMLQKSNLYDLQNYVQKL